MTRFSLGSVAMLALIVAMNNPAFAAAKKNNAVKAVVTGQNYCVGCALKKEGANAQCSTQGCRHALKVTEARDADGRVLKEMKGWTLHYLGNDKSAEFLTGHHQETVTLRGTIYRDERVIDVAAKGAATPKKPSTTKREGS